MIVCRHHKLSKVLAINTQVAYVAWCEESLLIITNDIAIIRAAASSCDALHLDITQLG